ncbi:M1 family metallopeptidase [Streptomyces sp. FH025]|uniref:M1 family metallopeptidase n=1 Tax=Streptomyces sp. FH025 TaxID=2815937 RepID=UPI0027DD3168|nr:M1 family metallopeptidase [Streptomyces sp. FH025]
MRRPLTLIAVLAVLLSAAAAPPGHTATDPARTPGTPAYTVELRSDATGAHWRGHERIAFTNTSAEPMDEVYLRLWDNAHGGCAAPAVRVSGLDGPYGVGCTALRVPLPHPLRRGDSGALEFDLAIDVPDGADRFGRDGAFYFLGNALPVLAVRDAAGWHLDPYTDNGESFFALVSDYAVTLDHPTGVLVPATGTAVDGPGAPGRTITKLTARQVREFAWAAGPFSRIEGRSPGGVRVAVHSATNVTAKDARHVLDLSLASVDALSTRYGAYPYGELDVVVDNAFSFGGMEYAAFVLDRVRPSAVVHEVAHQWWYGIVGDDQYRTPWLDESFAEYAMDLALNDIGEPGDPSDDGGPGGLGHAGEDCADLPPWQSVDERLTNPMRYWDAHPDRYGPVVYDRGSCALHDLSGLIGPETMATLLHDYARAHWYGVSTTADFKAAAQAAASVDLAPFWREHRID